MRSYLASSGYVIERCGEGIEKDGLGSVSVGNATVSRRNDTLRGMSIYPADYLLELETSCSGETTMGGKGISLVHELLSAERQKEVRWLRVQPRLGY